MCISVCLYVCVCVPSACNAHCGQKWASVLLELELQKAVSCHMGAETEPRSSARATSTLNH